MDDELLVVVTTWILCYIMLRRRRRQCRWRNRRWWVRPLNVNRPNQGAYDHLFQELKQDRDLFFRYTRMDVPTFNHLLQMVEPHLRKSSPRALPTELRLAITLRYFATADLMMTIALAYRIGESTAEAIIKETSRVIVHVLSPIYLKQPNEEEWETIMTGFLEQWNFPNCVGAIDGKHIVIQAPSNSGSQYFSYKKTLSIVLLAVCDANYKFTLVHAGEMGSNSDAGIFSNSPITQLTRDGQLGLPKGTAQLPGSEVRTPCFFVGDEAFPLSATMMRPYSGRGLSADRRIFNYRLSRARRTIENAFGILSSRWRIFRRPIALHPDFVDDILLSTICLHNFLKTRDEQLTPSRRLYCPPNFVDVEDRHGVVRPGMWRDLEPRCVPNLPPVPRYFAPESGIAIRNKLTEYFQTPEGEVPWQYDFVNNTGPDDHGHQCSLKSDYLIFYVNLLILVNKMSY